MDEPESRITLDLAIVPHDEFTVVMGRGDEVTRVQRLERKANAKYLPLTYTSQPTWVAISWKCRETGSKSPPQEARKALPRATGVTMRVRPPTQWESEWLELRYV